MQAEKNGRLKRTAGCCQFCCFYTKVSSSGENKLTPSLLYQGGKTRNRTPPDFPWPTFTNSNIVFAPW